MSDEDDQEDDGRPPPPIARKRPRPPGGKRRSAADVEILLRKIDALLLYAIPRSQVIVTMGSENQLAPRTVDKYIGIVRKRWDETIADREEVRRRQILRLYAQLRTLQAQGNHREVWRREVLLAKIEGTLAPLQLSAVVREQWNDLAPEQLKYIIDNGGKLPEGLTTEMLFPKR